MIWRVKVTGLGVVTAEGRHVPQVPVPEGEYTMSKRADGRYELADDKATYLLSAPKGAGAHGYVSQKVRDEALQILEGEWP